MCVILKIRMNRSQNPSAIRSKKQILEALLTLMEKYSYNEISVKQIVLETDLTRKTFYRNFSSKDDVLESYIGSIIAEYIDALNDETRPLNVIFSFCEKNKNLLGILHKHDMLHLLLKKLNEIIPSVIESPDYERNPFKKVFGDIEPDYLIAFNIGAIWNVINKWLELGMHEPLENVKAVLEKYLNSATS